MDESPAVILLLLLLGFTSHRGHKDALFRDQWLFDTERIRLRREYRRFVTCCGLHADIAHFIFNAITIYFFGGPLAFAWGWPWMLGIFFGAVASGSLLTYWLNRRNHYQSLGASGGACGLIFAYILTFPRSELSLGIIPVFIPAWLYAILFVVGSYIAHRRRRDNIGHLAHLGGAAGGILLTAVYAPKLVASAPWTTWLAAGFLLSACLYLALAPQGFKKHALTEDAESHRPNLRYQRYDEAARENQDRRRRDALLDKISQRGLESLSTREKQELETLSARLRPSRR